MTIPHTNAHHARLVTQFQTIMVDAALRQKIATRFWRRVLPLLTAVGAIMHAQVLRGLTGPAQGKAPKRARAQYRHANR
jgi:hypothetical protein